MEMKPIKTVDQGSIPDRTLQLLSITYTSKLVPQYI